MLSKTQLLTSISQETNVIKHLYSKMTPDQKDFCPGEKMRTCLELLRYLTVCGIAPVQALLNDDWKIPQKYIEESSKMEFEQFADAMDKQLAEIKEHLEPLSEEDFVKRDVKLPWGTEEKLGLALVNTSLKFLAAYKMQLFLYAKISGHSELSTHNCWIGVDKTS